VSLLVRISKSDIEKIGFMKNTSEKSKNRFIDLSEVKSYSKKQTIIREKEEVDKIYVLIDGKVSISKMSEDGELKIIFILNNGDLINEISFEEHHTSTVACEAFEKALVAEIPINDFKKIMKEDFNLTANLFNCTEKRTRRLYRQLKNSISIRVDKKLAAKLCRLSREFGINEGEWTYLNINITITYLADMLGTKRETLSRAMKTLQEKDLVKYEGKKIFVKTEKLVRYFKDNKQNS